MANTRLKVDINQIDYLDVLAQEIQRRESLESNKTRVFLDHGLKGYEKDVIVTSEYRHVSTQEAAP